MKKSLLAAIIIGASSTALADGVPVTADNFAHAMSDVYFQKVTDVVGTNVIMHTRVTKNVDNQNIIRENRDTLYSNAVVDARKGFTLTLPATDGVFMTALIFDQNTSLVRAVDSDVTGDVGTFQAYFDKPRTIRIERDALDTDYAYILFRTYSNGSPESEKIANRLQDQIVLKADSNIPWQPEGFNEADRLAIQNSYIPKLYDYVKQGTSKGYNERHLVTQDHQNFYAAIGWAGQLERYATYGTTPDLTISLDKCAQTTITPPPVDYSRGGFWSYQVYDKDGWIAHNNSTLQNTNTVLNDDGTVTLRFGTKEACGTDENRVDRNESFSVTTRIYNPKEPIPLNKRALQFD